MFSVKQLAVLLLGEIESLLYAVFLPVCGW